MLTPALQYIYLALGWLSLAAGIVGLFLPIVPTVPFVLFAAFCFSRGSKRLHRWMRQHRRFGRAIRDWEEHGAISRRSKTVATVMMAFSLVYPLFILDVHLGYKISFVVVMVSVTLFIWTRPDAPPAP